MRINWGYKIAGVYIAFVVFMLYMVFSTFQYDVNLVSKDYYKQEIAYQAEINKMQNVQNMAQAPVLEYSIKEDLVRIHLPEAEVNGEIWFFRPADGKQDFRVPLQLENGRQSLSCAKLSPGLWRLKMQWESRGKPFYVEKKIEVRVKESKL